MGRRAAQRHSPRVDGRPQKAPPAAALPAAATPRWVWAGLGGLLMFAYGNSLALGLAVDAPYVLSNSRVSALTAENVKLMFTRPYWWPLHSDDLFRPLTLLSFALSPGGLAHPWMHHAVNLLLHGLNVWLAFRLAWRVNGHVAAAAGVAALFAVHPVGTDAVTNIAGRADLLAAAAVLGGWLAHVRALESPHPARWRVLLALLSVLGFLSKENAVVLLPVLVLYDVAFGSLRRGRASYALVAGTLVIAGLARHAVLSDEMPHWQPFVDNPLAAAGFWEARLTALSTLGWSTALLVWPATLSADYSYDQVPVLGSSAGEIARWVIPSLLLAVAMSIAWRERVRRPAFFFWLFFFVGTRLPTANVLMTIGSVMAERFLYLPMLGVFGAAVSLMAPMALSSVRSRRKPAAAAFAAVLLALGVRTIVRNLDWKDDESIWRAAIQASPESYKPYKGLARVMSQAGRHEEALALFERSLAILDKRPLPAADRSSDLLLGAGEEYRAYADGLRASGRDADARLPYEKARALLVRAAETDSATNERVRVLRERRGESPAEITDVGVVRIHEALGQVALRLADLETAAQAFTWQRQLDPTHASAYRGLAETAGRAGRPHEQAMLLVEALILEPDDPALWQVLPAVAAREGIAGVGIEGGRVRIDPRDPGLAALVARACPDLASGLRRARRVQAAAEAESICARNLGYRGASGREGP